MTAALRCGVLLAGLLVAGGVLADPDEYARVVQGRALATVGDCVACHTAPSGAPFAGGLALETPFGAIITPNITPDEATGIGRWSADEFAQAMHAGLRPDGTHLYPAFPYTYYTRVSRQDTEAIYAYLRTLAPVSNSVDRSALPFPFSVRAGMIAWNAMFFTPDAFVPNPNKSEAFNRGAYLVQGLGHCGACHTPMNALGANKSAQFLQGNQISGWTAPNITNDMRQGLGKWSADEIVEYLRTGRTGTSVASGPMAEVVAYSTSQMPVADLKAIATYLKELGGTGSATPSPVDSSSAQMRIGEAIYVDACSACHTRAGSGIANIFPRLSGTAVVQQDDASTLMRIILTGARGAGTAAAPTAPAMPAFGYRLSDDQVAAVVTYIRNSWGNAAPAVTASAVATMREHTSHAAAR